MDSQLGAFASRYKIADIFCNVPKYRGKITGVLFTLIL